MTRRWIGWLAVLAICGTGAALTAAEVNVAELTRELSGERPAAKRSAEQLEAAYATVLGALMSRLYFIIVLLLSGLPIACITMIYGGVTAPIIFKSFAVAAGTAVFTGSLAIAVSVIQVGTRRTVLSFYLFIGVYLAAVGFLGTLAKFQVPEAPPAGDMPSMSFLAPFHPFLALFTALNMVPAPAAADVVHYGWPLRSLLANPTQGFVTLTLSVTEPSWESKRCGTACSSGARNRPAADCGKSLVACGRTRWPGVRRPRGLR